MSSSLETYTCALCLEARPHSMPSHNIHSLTVCQHCLEGRIIPLIHAAAQHEHNYPLEIAPRKLIDASRFAALLAEEFMSRYEIREREYKIPVADRVYCAHKVLQANAILPGQSAEHAIALSESELATAEAKGEPIIECGAMATTTQNIVYDYNFLCYHCRSEISTGDIRRRRAQAQTDSGIEDPSESFLQDMLREGEYQLCPGCHVSIELREACNHISCRCGTEFCFLCRLPAREGSGHWCQGGCPQYGKAGAANAPLHPERDPRLDGPAEGETWLTISLQTMQSYSAYADALTAELMAAELYRHVPAFGENGEDLWRLAAGVKESLDRQSMPTQFDPTGARAAEIYHNWMERDITIQLALRDEHALIRVVRERTPLPADALDFFMEHRVAFERDMRQHVALNMPRQRHQDIGLIAPTPGQNFIRDEHRRAVFDRRFRLAMAFTSEVSEQSVRHPDTRALLNDSRTLLSMVSVLRSLVSGIVFLPQETHSGLSTSWRIEFSEDHLSTFRTESALIAVWRAGTPLDRERFPRLAEALDFYDRNGNDSIVQVEAYLEELREGTSVSDS